MSLVSTASDRSPLVPVKERSNSIADPLGAVDRARACRARWRRAIMQQILENRLAKHRKMRGSSLPPSVCVVGRPGVCVIGIRAP
jgi:hypothetical protein